MPHLLVWIFIVAVGAGMFLATQFAGGTYVNTTFTGDTRANILAALLSNLVTAGWTNQTQVAGQGPGNVGTVTITIASPAVVTFTSHGYLGGEKVILSTSGALPTGLSVNTEYFVKFIDANTFNLSATSGGSNINTSGSQSGTHKLNSELWQFKSATQSNVTNPILVNIQDNLTNQVLVFGIQNTAGTLVGSTGGANNGGVLKPAAAQTFNLLATKYWFFCKYAGVMTVGRSMVYAGMLYVPADNSTTDQGFMFSNAIAANNTNLAHSFQDGLQDMASGNIPNSQSIFGSSLLDVNGSPSANQGIPNWVCTQCPVSGTHGNRWKNDKLNECDVLLCHGATANTDEGKIVGQFYDLVCIYEAFSMEVTDTFNGHNWLNCTNNNTNFPKGGFWMATS